MPRKAKRAEKKRDDDEEVGAHESASPASLYEVLGVERNATHEEIRKAYHKLALRLHPDKNPGDQDAKEKFQSLQNIIAVLGDPEKRKVYDETGSIEDAELSSETVKSLFQFFRTIYKKVTEDDIEEFASSYQGSETENKDLKDLYTKCEGKMDRVFDQLMCSDPKQDSHRFMDVINDAISAGELKEYDVYRRWAQKIAKKPRPEPLKRTTRKGKSSEGHDADLLAIISNRQKQRNVVDSIAASLEAKYSGSKRSQKSKTYQEPSEEEFEAAQRRIKEKRTKKSK